MEDHRLGSPGTRSRPTALRSCEVTQHGTATTRASGLRAGVARSEACSNSARVSGGKNLVPRDLVPRSRARRQSTRLGSFQLQGRQTTIRQRHRQSRLGFVPWHCRSHAMAPVGEPRVIRTRGVRIGPRPSSPQEWLEPGGQLVRQGPGPCASRGQSSAVALLQSYSCRRLGATSGAGPDARRPEVLSGRLQFVGLVNSVGHQRHGVIPSTWADSRF